MIEKNSFTEIAAILGLATAAGITGRKLKQPLIIMFLATGILAGPSFLGIIEGYDQIELLAHIGIALLLFIVGLKLDLNLIKTTGPVALATGLGQIFFTSLIGFAIAVLMEFDMLSSAYIAVALTFSSTIIIVKLLSDKKEIDSLHGQIAIGFLIVQDIAAILALVGLTTFGIAMKSDEPGYISVAVIAAKGIGILAGTGLLMKFVIPALTKKLAKSLELLTLFAIAWAVTLASVSELLGFSKEVGAFLAGVSLASTDYRDSIGARLMTLRDFLLLFFFIDLGARLDWASTGAQAGASAVFSVFVLLGNPLIVLMIMGYMGYRRRTGFLAGLTVAQISEFSLIVAALGYSLGHISGETVGLITMVGVVTIFISTYMILYSIPLYNTLSEPLRMFERKFPFREAAIDTLKKDQMIDVILVGMGNYGRRMAEHLLRRKMSILCVDFDPGTLDLWRGQGIPVLFGDITDPGLHEDLPLRTAKWVISTVRSRELNLLLISDLRKSGYNVKIALTATSDKDSDDLKAAGADLVFRPFRDATELAADALTSAADFLPENIDWPISFSEIRIRSDAVSAGRTVRDLALTGAGISVLAVSRAGKIYYEPEPDFRVFPSDRLLLMGRPESLRESEMILNRLAEHDGAEGNSRFELAEIAVSEGSVVSGRSVSELQFRQKYGTTIVGIRRGDEKITHIDPSFSLLSGDGIIVIGKSASVNRLKEMSPI